MSFKNPEYLYLLIVVALYFILSLYYLFKKKRMLNEFLSENSQNGLVKRSGREIDFFKLILITLSLIFFVIALSSPQWGEKYEDMNIKGIEVLFALDCSNSMLAQDLKPNRFEVSKQLIIKLSQALKTDYVGLINFAGVSYVQCPLTIDKEAFKLFTRASLISDESEQGTNFSNAFALMLKIFEKSHSSNKIVIFITDGEDQEGGWESFIDEFKKRNISVFACGVGVREGAPIPVFDNENNIIGWKKDKNGNIVKTVLDEKTLIKIASSTNGRYFRLTDIAGIERFVKILKEYERGIIKKRFKVIKINRFQYPLLIGIILFVLQLLLTEKRMQWRKK